MKKFKKILSAVSAAVLCSIPMVNGVAANAVRPGQYDTYMVFCDVEANSGVQYCNMTVVHNGEDQAQAMHGNLGNGDINTYITKRVDGKISYATMYEANGALAAKGTVFQVKVVTEPKVPKTKIPVEVNDPSAFDVNHVFLGKGVATPDIVMIGDVDGDDIVNINDAILIEQHLANSTKYPLEEKAFRAADVNYDGVVNDEDALLIQYYEAGTIKHF